MAEHPQSKPGKDKSFYQRLQNFSTDRYDPPLKNAPKGTPFAQKTPKQREITEEQARLTRQKAMQDLLYSAEKSKPTKANGSNNFSTFRGRVVKDKQLDA